jgi:hypothetical protein
LLNTSKHFEKFVKNLITSCFWIDQSHYIHKFQLTNNMKAFHEWLHLKIWMFLLWCDTFLLL